MTALLGLLLGALAVLAVRRWLRRRNERAWIEECVRWGPRTAAGRLRMAQQLSDAGVIGPESVRTLLDDGERERVRLHLVREDQRARERGL